MSERTVEVRSRLRSSRRDRRALFIQDNDRANRLMGNGLIFKKKVYSQNKTIIDESYLGLNFSRDKPESN